MSFFNILYTILIGPIQLIYEIIFSITNRVIENPGLSIIALSLMMNLLVLPLYRRADAMQEESRDIEAKLHKGVAHIKKTFHGDERMMILQTYYRQNNYKPTNALNGSVSLLLEIPFFIAAYQFLSHLPILQGVSLGPISDLSAPDGLIVLGGLTINLLPILMTAINVISGALYSKGFPLKTKIQLYGMALIFLVFLYNSPAGLVFYWTLNNVFSLIKTLFYKLKNPRKVLKYLCCAIGILIFVYAVVFCGTEHIKRGLFAIAVALICEIPIISPLLKKQKWYQPSFQTEPSNKKLFLLGSIFLTVLIGLLIPSSLIADSPGEFINLANLYNPLWFIVSAFCLAAGSFLVWLRVFYWIANPTGKIIFEKLVWILCGVALIDYMFFGTNLGVISPALQYDNPLYFTVKQEAFNALILLGTAILLLFAHKHRKKAISFLLVVCIIAISCMGTANMFTINKTMETAQTQRQYSSDFPQFPLSKTEKNVIVLMLDRAMGEYIPYLFQERPELEQQFDGFTYYSNTLSLGGYTIFSAPSLFGGYDYTPVQMNKRDSELLVNKHNEALKVLPVLFDKHGYEVSVCDPVYANYQWFPDVTIYDEYPSIHAYTTAGKFASTKTSEAQNEQNKRNFFCFSLMKVAPLCLQEILYNQGNYNRAKVDEDPEAYIVQTIDSVSTASGIRGSFMEYYNVLSDMESLTFIEENSKGTFLMMSNNLTHEPMILQEPEYIPSFYVDNTEYDAAHTDRYTVDGRTMRMEEIDHYTHYQTNMATMLLLGDWFDYLRENNVYDNTKIILVSDHGFDAYHQDIFNYEGKFCMERYFPLLLVKDFNSTGFTTSDEFMTNADVATLATSDVIENPVNPFTGNPINSNDKTAHKQYVTLSMEWDTTTNNGTTFLPDKWCTVENDIWDQNNWKIVSSEKVILPPGAE